MDIKETVYKRKNVHGILAVKGERIQREGTQFFRKTYDLAAIKGEDKKSTYDEARMTETMQRILPDERYFPKVLNYGEDFIETEFIYGETIASILNIESPNDPDFKQDDEDIIREVWQALKDSDQKVKQIHAENMLHHDLHLDNIMIVRDDAGSHATFIDYEKSKMMSDNPSIAKTQVDFDRRFILKAALIIGLKMKEFRKDPLFLEAFKKKKQLFRELSGMNLEECIQEIRVTPKKTTDIENQRSKMQAILDKMNNPQIPV
jgi:predicted Ser/Thr protein kinase